MHTCTHTHKHMNTHTYIHAYIHNNIMHTYLIMACGLVFSYLLSHGRGVPHGAGLDMAIKFCKLSLPPTPSVVMTTKHME